MKRHLSLLMLVLCATLCFAQANNDAQAKAIVDKAVAQVQRNALKFNFKTTYVAGNSGETNTQEGTCAVSGKKSYVKFAGIETFFDGKTQWVFMTDNNEVSISEPTPAEQREVNPMLMLGDYAQTHRVGFDVDTDAANHLLCLYPSVAAQVDYFRIKLAIDKQTYRVRRIEFCQRNADRIIIEITSQQPLPKDFNFAFDHSKYPNVEWNDLR